MNGLTRLAAAATPPPTAAAADRRPRPSSTASKFAMRNVSPRLLLPSADPPAPQPRPRCIRPGTRGPTAGVQRRSRREPAAHGPCPPIDAVRAQSNGTPSRRRRRRLPQERRGGRGLRALLPRDSGSRASEHWIGPRRRDAHAQSCDASLLHLGRAQARNDACARRQDERCVPERVARCAQFGRISKKLGQPGVPPTRSWRAAGKRRPRCIGGRRPSTVSMISSGSMPCSRSTSRRGCGTDRGRHSSARVCGPCCRSPPRRIAAMITTIRGVGREPARYADRRAAIERASVLRASRRTRSAAADPSGTAALLHRGHEASRTSTGFER